MCSSNVVAEAREPLAALLADMAAALSPDDPSGVTIGPVDFGSGRASRSGQVATVPAEPVRQSDTATTVSDGTPIVRGAGDANGTFVAETCAQGDR